MEYFGEIIEKYTLIMPFVGLKTMCHETMKVYYIYILGVSMQVIVLYLVQNLFKFKKLTKPAKFDIDKNFQEVFAFLDENVRFTVVSIIRLNFVFWGEVRT